MEESSLPLIGPPGRFWMRADYLMWWTSGMRLPPLVTTSPQGTPETEAGVLGFPNTSILYGDKSVDNGGRSGYRTTLGMKLGEFSRWGVQFDYFSLGELVDRFNATSTGDPILARPLFNMELGQQGSVIAAFPGDLEGTLSIDAKEYFQSAGVLFSYTFGSNDMSAEWRDVDSNADFSEAPVNYGSRTDLLIGLRYENLTDSVSINQNTRIVGLDSTEAIRDIFHARNDFYGSEIGFRSLIYRGRWSLDFLTKIALGNNSKTVLINGQTVITAPNQTTQTYESGVLAGPTNSGIYHQNVFTMIPQAGLELGYQFNAHCRASLGYNILYWGSVSRAADQIDLNVDPRNFPPPTPGAVAVPCRCQQDYKLLGRTGSTWARNSVSKNLGKQPFTGWGLAHFRWFRRENWDSPRERLLGE